MKASPDKNLNLIELPKDDASTLKLNSTYSTKSYYDLAITHEIHSWHVELKARRFDNPVTKVYTGTLFEDHIVEPRVFAAVFDGIQRGWIELGYEKWNNRMRVWELLVEQQWRGQGVGTLLMDKAIEVARERGARMLVLETQSCNAPAIDFYVKNGFILIGFDSTAYSNEDVVKKEVRIEMGLAL